MTIQSEPFWTSPSNQHRNRLREQHRLEMTPDDRLEAHALLNLRKAARVVQQIKRLADEYRSVQDETG